MIIQDGLLHNSLMSCINDAFDEINTTRIEKIQTDALIDIHLYGQHGVFDSLQLVDFIMVLEEKIVERVGAPVSIVSEKAFSRQVNPFATVTTLLDFVAEELARSTPDWKSEQLITRALFRHFTQQQGQRGSAPDCAPVTSLHPLEN